MSIGLGVVGIILGLMVAAGTIIGIWKSGGPWKSVAEALEKKLHYAEAEITSLKARVVELEGATNLEMVTGLIVRHGLLLDAIEDRLEQLGSTTTEAIKDLVKVLEDRDGAIVEALQLRTRDPSTRTRRTDKKVL